MRSLVEVKSKAPIELQPYTQVFTNKYDFESNLSILDLLFNEGPNATNYLQNQLLRF